MSDSRIEFETAIRAKYADNPDQEHSLEEILEWTETHGYWLDSTSCQFQGWQLALSVAPAPVEPVAYVPTIHTTGWTDDDIMVPRCNICGLVVMKVIAERKAERLLAGN